MNPLEIVAEGTFFSAVNTVTFKYQIVKLVSVLETVRLLRCILMSYKATVVGLYAGHVCIQ